MRTSCTWRRAVEYNFFIEMSVVYDFNDCVCRLICRVVTTVPPPAYVFWYKEKAMVNYDYSDRLESALYVIPLFDLLYTMCFAAKLF